VLQSSWRPPAFYLTVLASESSRTLAEELAVTDTDTFAIVLTRVGAAGAGQLNITRFSHPAWFTAASVAVIRADLTGSTVLAGVGHTGALDHVLTVSALPAFPAQTDKVSAGFRFTATTVLTGVGGTGSRDLFFTVPASESNRTFAGITANAIIYT